jgi:NAD(P)-dependent dehydrogenase (short-subunit alcohol dehydrogenase family)
MPARIPAADRMHAVHLELHDARSIDEGFRAALQEAGHFDVVINNAGSGHFGPFESVSDETLLNHFQALVIAQVHVMRLGLASMRPRQQGLIINVTSLAARLPVPFMAAYNAAKAAMASLTLSIQLELLDSKIRIVDLQPGDISTNFNEAAQRTESRDLRVAKAWEAVDRNMKKAPKPELVAKRILRLIEERNPPPRITVGDFFQSRIAPFIFRFLPQRLRLWGLKNYYGI